MVRVATHLIGSTARGVVVDIPSTDTTDGSGGGGWTSYSNSEVDTGKVRCTATLLQLNCGQGGDRWYFGGEPLKVLVLTGGNGNLNFF